jgi:hypothetical protein
MKVEYNGIKYANVRTFNKPYIKNFVCKDTKKRNSFWIKSYL